MDLCAVTLLHVYMGRKDAVSRHRKQAAKLASICKPRTRPAGEAMPFINYASREIHCKVVYYGPGLSGKTTNVEQLHEHSQPERRGELISLKTDTDRTLFFDFMPLSIGKIRGFSVRFHLYSVPGQVFYNASRKLIMRGADAIVFVADSQQEREIANQESYESLHFNLEEQGRSLDELAYILQCNKRDLDAESCLPIEQMRTDLSPPGAQLIPAIANQNKGVVRTLKTAAKMVLLDLKNKGG